MSDSPFNFATAALSEWSAEMLGKLAGGFDMMAKVPAPARESHRDSLGDDQAAVHGKSHAGHE
jgi:hypothetical protein